MSQMQVQHKLFLYWQLLTVAICGGLFVAWDQGLLTKLYSSDRSLISWAISALFLVTIIHAGIRAAYLSSLLNIANRAKALFYSAKNTSNPSFCTDQQMIKEPINQLPESPIKDYLQDYWELPEIDRPKTQDSSDSLITSYEYQLKEPQEIGWLATDIMLKLGLVGTIVGFILMLASVSDVEEFDVSTMQNILQLMSGGMATALYTTLTGIACSLIAGFQYYLLDKSANHVIDSMRYISISVISRFKTTLPS